MHACRAQGATTHWQSRPLRLGATSRQVATWAQSMRIIGLWVRVGCVASHDGCVGREKSLLISGLCAE